MIDIRPSKRLRAWLTIRPAICAWFEANNIDPESVPASALPAIRNGKITVDVYLRRGGHLYVKPGTDDLARGHVTVPLKTEPPAQLAAWLRGEVPYR